jgi:hypothetical protein
MCHCSARKDSGNQKRRMAIDEMQRLKNVQLTIKPLEVI